MNLSNEKNRFDLLIDSYLENEVGIDNKFMTVQLSAGLVANIKQLMSDELLEVAGIGNKENKASGQAMRGDKIHWLEKDSENAFEREFLQLAEDFIYYLNSTCYAGITGYEFHYAVYDEGTFYKRHKDQFKNNNSRKYSLISYLNDNWQESDGGQLKVYPASGEQSIPPHAQTAVFFKSDEMEHEVAVSTKIRMSISGWLKQETT